MIFGIIVGARSSGRIPEPYGNGKIAIISYYIRAEIVSRCGRPGQGDEMRFAVDSLQITAKTAERGPSSGYTGASPLDGFKNL
jgi:hypothetical protein